MQWWIQRGLRGFATFENAEKEKKRERKEEKRVNLNRPKNTVRENVSAVFVLMSEML